jgi:hypothetical protein
MQNKPRNCSRVIMQQLKLEYFEVALKCQVQLQLIFPIQLKRQIRL